MEGKRFDKFSIDSSLNSVVFVGGLHANITSTHLDRLLSPYGSIASVRMHHRYAFCHYRSAASAQAAVLALDGRMLLGKRLTVQLKQHKRERQQGLADVENQIRAIRRKLDC